MTGIGLFMLGINVQRHGQPRTGKHNAIITLIALLWQLLFLLWAGGWKVW